MYIHINSNKGIKIFEGYSSVNFMVMSHCCEVLLKLNKRNTLPFESELIVLKLLLYYLLNVTDIQNE